MKARVNTVSIPLKEIFKFPGNPNVQDSNTFANLVEEIAEDGFEEPLIVVPRENIEPGLEGFYVVSGNHRLLALKKLGFQEVDCVVHEDWDADQARIKVVKRNQMRGSPDPDKFSKLVSHLTEYTHDQLADAMGFRDIDEFAEVYRTKDSAVEVDDAGRHYENLIDGMKLILNRMFSDYGESVPYGFMYFLWGKKIHMAIMASRKTKKHINRIALECNRYGIDFNKVLGTVLEAGIASVKFHEYEDEDDKGDLEFIPLSDHES